MGFIVSHVKNLCIIEKHVQILTDESELFHRKVIEIKLEYELLLIDIHV